MSQKISESKKILQKVIRPWNFANEDYSTLLDSIGNAEIVLIGEASHGTHDFYRQRALITRKLIEERGFSAVAVEGDWPDCHKVNEFVQGRCKGRKGLCDAVESLEGFQRFPGWMWRNSDVLDFIGWLRDHNAENVTSKAGFYGLDLYSLHKSMAAVLDYLSKKDAPAFHRAQNRYACFDNFGDDTQHYGLCTGLGLAPSCEQEVHEQLMEFTAKQPALEAVNGEDYFTAFMNAKVVADAEEYYRKMFDRSVSTWNLRDTHMMQVVDALREHLTRAGQAAKIVIWAHNSHLGDARATEMGKRREELNLGQLCREKFGDACYNIGFTTYSGTVTAASNWDSVAERKRVRPGMEGSYEELFHQLDCPNFALDLRAVRAAEALALTSPLPKPKEALAAGSVGSSDSGAGHLGALVVELPGRGGVHLSPTDVLSAAKVLRGPLLERAIGVVYKPETERASHYFKAELLTQFDFVLHFDHTRAVEPLERGEEWTRGEFPDTYPSGI